MLPTASAPLGMCSLAEAHQKSAAVAIDKTSAPGSLHMVSWSTRLDLSLWCVPSLHIDESMQYFPLETDVLWRGADTTTVSILNTARLSSPPLLDSMHKSAEQRVQADLEKLDVFF